MDRRDYLKPSRFGNAEKRRLLDSQNLKEKRSFRRTANFNLRRDIDAIAQVVKKDTIENVPPKTKKVIDRKLALQKFKAEKEAQKKALKEKKKPPFVVGIPHHGSSPHLRDVNPENKTKKETNALEVRSKRITRATTRKVQTNVLKEKPKVNGQPRNAHIFKAPPSVKVFPFTENKTAFPYYVPASAKKLTSPHTPTVLKRSVQKKPLKNVSNLVRKLKKSPESSPHNDVDEELAAPLSMSQETEKQEEAATRIRATKKRNKTSGNVFAALTEDSEVKQNEVEGIINGEDNELARQVAFQQSNLVRKLKKSPESSPYNDVDGELAAPLSMSQETEKQEEAATRRIRTKKERRSGSASAALTEDSEVKQDEVEGIVKNEDNELAIQVAFQYSRLEAETTRLLELAEQWQTVALHESMPQEVVDEVDSLVGQTRLLTGDKFQQFRRLVVQYEQKTGTHPITLDDLNGFWDMVYLQVESLDKRYAALDTLKNSNWVKPVVAASKKKRRPAKNLIVNKVTEAEKSSTPEMKRKLSSLQLQKCQEIQTQTAEVIPVLHNVLLSTKRTRSNSPSPYIAMRLSGVGRTPNMVHPPGTNGNPRSTLVDSNEACGTPKGVLKKSLTTRNQPSMLPSVTPTENKIEEAENLIDTEESLIPAKTPRRSVRLMVKALLTPASCAACEPSSSTKASSSKNTRSSKKLLQLSPSETQQTKLTGSTNASSTKNTRYSKKLLKFSPSEPLQTNDSATVTELTQTKETDINKPSTSGVRFSLRPSLLAMVSENNNISEKPKKAKKRNQSSLFTVVEQDGEGTSRSQRSTRQSRKVTFDSGAEEKARFKLPATPYRKYVADS